MSPPQVLDAWGQDSYCGPDWRLRRLWAGPGDEFEFFVGERHVFGGPAPVDSSRPFEGDLEDARERALAALGPGGGGEGGARPRAGRLGPRWWRLLLAVSVGGSVHAADCSGGPPSEDRKISTL